MIVKVWPVNKVANKYIGFFFLKYKSGAHTKALPYFFRIENNNLCVHFTFDACKNLNKVIKSYVSDLDQMDYKHLENVALTDLVAEICRENLKVYRNIKKFKGNLQTYI